MAPCAKKKQRLEARDAFFFCQNRDEISQKMSSKWLLVGKKKRLEAREFSGCNAFTCLKKIGDAICIPLGSNTNLPIPLLHALATELPLVLNQVMDLRVGPVRLKTNNRPGSIPNLKLDLFQMFNKKILLLIQSNNF